jgi:hypothetical protein
MNTFNTATVIHIDEALSDSQLEAFERDLAQTPGVRSACVHENTHHLMVVDYDPLDTSQAALLNNIQSLGLHAELVGGI